MRLTNNELRAVLERAEEIQRESEELNVDVDAVLSAAEEVGLSRQAVERALSERLNISMARPVVGDLCWAKSVDGKFYVAKLMSLTETSASVRFIRGSAHTVSMDELRPCSFIPGERVVCNWPWWGPWTCSVVSYNADLMEVTLTDGWGDIKVFPISEVWAAAPKPAPNTSRRRIYATLIGTGAVVGAVIGAIATAILMR